MNRGFHIKNFHADREFYPLQDVVYENIPEVPRINPTSANEHIPDIERWIRVFKYRTRAGGYILPFNKTPKLLTIYIVFAVVRMLNYFPLKGGVSAILIPKTIVAGDKPHCKRLIGLNIGQYFQVHEHEDPRKRQVPRTKGTVCLGPSGNEQGGFQFMSLNLTKNITRRSWYTILMPDTIIACVNKITCNEPNQFIFTYRRGHPIGDANITVVDRYTGDSKKIGPTRPSPQVPGNRRDRGGASHTRYKNWPRRQPWGTHRTGTGTRGTTWISHNSHSPTSNDWDKLTS